MVSKRKLLQLVEQGVVNGWTTRECRQFPVCVGGDTTPESIRSFADTVGIAKRENVVDVSLLEFHVREHLNRIAPRVMAVLNPVKLIITNYPGRRNRMAGGRK